MFYCLGIVFKFCLYVLIVIWYSHNITAVFLFFLCCQFVHKLKINIEENVGSTHYWFCACVEGAYWKFLSTSWLLTVPLEVRSLIWLLQIENRASALCLMCWYNFFINSFNNVYHEVKMYKYYTRYCYQSLLVVYLLIDSNKNLKH